MKNTLLKEILAFHKTALKTFHDDFKFDCEKDIEVEKFTGKFTLGQIDKSLAEKGITYKDYATYILIGFANAEKTSYNYGLRVVRKTYGNTFELAKVSWQKGDWKDRLDDFCRKCDFEDWRKSGCEDLVAYVVSQKMELLAPPKKSGGEYYIERIKFLPADGFAGGNAINLDNGEHIRAYRGEERDKSGYNVQGARVDLHQRVRKFKADRRKAEYLVTDNSAKVLVVKELIDRLQKKAVEALKSARTYDDFRAVEDMIGYGGLRSLASNFENFKKRTEAKEYASIEDSEYAYESMMEKLEKLLGLEA